MEIVLPKGWKRPQGYSNAIKAKGTYLFIAGLVGWDENEIFQSEELVAQFEQTLINTKTLLEEGGARPEDMVRMTWYITSKSDYLEQLSEIGEIYRKILGKNFPAMACIEVKALIEDKARIEIETTAVIPD